MRLIVSLLLSSLLVVGCDRQKAAAPQPEPVAQAVRGIDRSHKGEPTPAAEFKNSDGGDFSLANSKGLPVLVNIWATWCAPCVKELPTLDKFAATHRLDGQFGVIAVSQDSGPQGSVAAFLAKLGIEDLGAFHDPEMKLGTALGVTTMPTTILYDRDGREVWRYVGDLDWTGAEAKALLAEVS